MTRQRRAPGPRLWDLPRTLLAIRGDRLAFVREMVSRFGEVIRIPAGFREVFLVSSPSGAKRVLSTNSANYEKGIGLREAHPLLGQGLLTSEGERWRSQHNRIKPLFQPSSFTAFLRVASAEANKLLARWSADSAMGASINVFHQMTDLTLRVLGRTLVGAHLEMYTRVIESTVRTIARHAMLVMTFPFMAYAPTLGNLRYHLALRKLNRIVSDLIEHHVSSGTEDIFSAMSRDIASVDPREQRTMLRDEIVTLLVAGHETTSALLAWTCSLLARHPSIQDRLAREVDAVLVDDVVTLDQIEDLRYARQVLEEAMRMYPPVWVLSRRAIETDEIDGYHIPAGAAVLVSVYALHNSRPCWTNPDVFDPDRFAATQSKQRTAFEYLPFGAGARHCIGQQHGLLEAICIVALLIRKFRLVPTTEHMEAAELLLTLRPRIDVTLTLLPRKSNRDEHSESDLRR